MNVLSVDVGYSGTKVVSGDEIKIDKVFEINSVVAQVPRNDLVSDDRLVSYDGNTYYVGSDALAVQTESIIEITDYSKLEYFAPLFVSKAIQESGMSPDILVLGLSIAQISNSGYYKDKIENFLKAAGLNPKIFVVPQGAIAKIAIDYYGDHFPEKNKEFNSNATYLIGDLGFNTLDVGHVVNGKISSNLVRGLEYEGIIVIAKEVKEKILEEFNVDLSIPEVKDVLLTNQFKRRGKAYDCKKIVADAKKNYIERLFGIIEKEFGKILDKVDNFYLIGGGAYIFAKDADDFVKVPKQSAEFYNAIGFYHWGVQNGQ